MLMPVATGDLLAALGFALVIVCAWVGVRGIAWLGSRPLSGMGTISYGFYLWHVPVLIWMRAHDHLPLSAVGAMAVALPIVLVIANTSWRYIEQPLLNRAHGVRLKRRRVPPLPSPRPPRSADRSSAARR